VDHIEGLHVINKFSFTGLSILGQKGTAQILGTIINEPFTVPLDRLLFPVEFREILPGAHKLGFPPR
jgi:hypothetical protein